MPKSTASTKQGSLQLGLWSTARKWNAFSQLREQVNFRHNDGEPIHRWVNWVAGFSAQFVDKALDEYAPSNVQSIQVCDPFAGVGTTLLEALKHGCHSVGFEINPWAALVARTKLAAPETSVDHLGKYIQRFDEEMDRLEKQIDEAYRASNSATSFEKLCDIKPASTVPPGFRTRIPFYSPPVERKVLCVFDFIRQIQEPAIRDLFRIAFGQEMVSFSNYTYEPSLGSRTGADKPCIDNASVHKPLLSLLQMMKNDIRVFQERHSKVLSVPWRVVRADFFEHAEEELLDSSIDLVVTSPPYLNNYHYIRNTRPQLYWLGFGQKPKDFRYLQDLNYGKYWQTVRDQAPIPLDFDLSELGNTLELIRSVKKENSTYDGTGWANYVATYFNDTKRFLDRLVICLKTDGRALLVVGNSIIQGVNIDVPELVGKMAPQSGLTAENVFLLQTKRTGNSIVSTGARKNARKEKAHLYEAVVILRK